MRATCLRAFVALAFCLAASAAANAQHEGHVGHTAPKRTAPKRTVRKRAATKPKPARRKSPVARTVKTRTEPRRAVQQGHEGHTAPQAPAPTAPVPASAPVSTATEPAPHTHTPATETPPAPPAHTHPPATAPTSAPPATQAQPAAHDTHAAPPQHEGHKEGAKESPTATPAPAGHSGHTPDAKPAVRAEPAGAAQTAAPVATGHEGHTAADATGGVSRVSESDVDELMVMSGDEMGIRVGRSRENFTPMGQIASGTAWQPSSSPMNMWHKRAGDWLVMFHGEAKLGVNSQTGPRGVTKFESQNWFMPMAYRRVGPGTLQLRGMFSLEPFTFSGAGSPQLFQTGEVFRGRPIIDAQHPHDLFMELSAQYTVPVGERGTWFAYFGYPGEPALGPVAFMHRASASENPTAPLTHHLQDSTHISFGLVTTGFTYRWFKLEGSVFNGREPDEHRYNLEYNPWTSRSARLSFAPNANWTFQISHGFLRNPEQLEEGDTRRTTASVQHVRNFARGHVATAFVWGRNHESHGGHLFNLNGYTFESTARFLERNYLYTRLELVDKNALLREEDVHRLGLSHEDEHRTFRIGAYTFGYVRDIWDTQDWSVGLGGDFTFYSKPALLDPLYGRNPTSYKLFLRIRPGRMKMEHAGHDRSAPRDKPAAPHKH